MKRTLAAVAVFLVLLLSAANAQDPAPAPPDWRKLKTTNAFLWKYLQKDSKRHDVPPLALVQQFAEAAKVSVRFDEPSLARMPAISLALGEGAETPVLFDLCQLALAPRYTLLPEGGDGRFAVCPVADAGTRAARVDAASLATLASQEWAVVTLDLQGRDARVVERGLQPLRGLSGRLEIVNDGRSLLAIDIAYNLRRMNDLLPSLDRVRELVPLVPYQRSTRADLGRLVTSLRAMMILFARNSGIGESEIQLAWDEKTGLIAGMVPRPLAATLDHAIEAADEHQARTDAEAVAEPKRFVQFSMSAPAGMEVTQFSARLRMLFETEANGGHARFVPKDDKAPTLFVRCRPWLEAEIREAAALMSN